MAIPGCGLQPPAEKQERAGSSHRRGPAAPCNKPIESCRGGAAQDRALRVMAKGRERPTSRPPEQPKPALFAGACRGPACSEGVYIQWILYAFAPEREEVSRLKSIRASTNQIQAADTVGRRSWSRFMRRGLSFHALLRSTTQRFGRIGNGVNSCDSCANSGSWFGPTHCWLRNCVVNPRPSP